MTRLFEESVPFSIAVDRGEVAIAQLTLAGNWIWPGSSRCPKR
ncbi:hypothetical protein [Amycolatopsis sp. NPDC059021]